MITGELKNEIDQLWEKFWTGGITNPLTVIEQISFLMFARLLDIQETTAERRAARTKQPFDRVFPQDKEGQLLRWQNFKNMPGSEMLTHVKQSVFPHFASVTVAETDFGEYMADADLEIKSAQVLQAAVEMIDKLPLTSGDTKGDLYEYLLSKLTTAGINGQFRTPRHVIDLMVAMLDVKPDETVCDPACGTAGFLARVMEYLNKTHTSPDMISQDEDGNPIYVGDQLEPFRDHITRDMFWGFDFDTTMLRISSMNMLLHGVNHANIHYQDSLNKSINDHWPRQAENCFDVVLANPPFKGSIDDTSINKDILAMVKTKKTELLFVAHILRMLKLGGRSATIVPDGVLFGSSKAHQQLRRLLIEENQLEAVISLPSGVFKPYAGVSTAIIVFTKGGQTDNVWFYDVENDGYSLDDKRTRIDKDDLPDCLEKWQAYRAGKAEGLGDKTAKAFLVPAEDIRGNKYDLSINRYKEVVYEEEHYDPPKEILGRLMALEEEIQQELKELEGML
ncbi:N-6 DNA methylase [Halioglobus japonicus]|uniref:site-specific DNA-methyltransferase (adenine-specific) n=1 Tax=Halioglobus japonicus TaxID=930805 RepID=A0AAP8MEH8_9GAMM|nr:class I SAM-dependent DNA methyltransferase [Halioglobus japonicus]AQA18345.1 N-6 DNA methylase [Halioglobus japonicus]PLW86363.1 SAM-dependent DNA methyltransferase [Halioglobus japonicus]GHD13265.1 DNA methyltransferase [Halioglobus japonicus]